jgi:hypothetical protein
MSLKILILAIVILFINIPFGYWRAGVKRLSAPWFMAIHIPVLISVAFRLLAEIDSHWTILITFILAFLLGQFGGKLVYKCRKFDNCL